MTSHFGSKGWIIWGRKGVIKEFGKCPGLYRASHHTEANGGKLGGGGRKRKKKEAAGWNMDSIIVFKIINQWSIQYTEDGRIWQIEKRANTDLWTYSQYPACILRKILCKLSSAPTGLQAIPGKTNLSVHIQTLSFLKHPKMQSSYSCQENVVLLLWYLTKPSSPVTHQLHIHCLYSLTHLSQTG